MKIPSLKMTGVAKKVMQPKEKSLSAFVEGVAVILRTKAKESLLKKKSITAGGEKDLSIANVVEQVAQILRKESHKVNKGRANS